MDIAFHHFKDVLLMGVMESVLLVLVILLLLILLPMKSYVFNKFNFLNHLLFKFTQLGQVIVFFLTPVTV
jgi:hypothetical protein